MKNKDYDEKKTSVEVARIYLTTMEDSEVFMGMDYDNRLIPEETAVSLAENLEGIVMNLDKKDFHKIYTSRSPVATIHFHMETKTYHIILNENLPVLKTAGPIQ